MIVHHLSVLCQTGGLLARNQAPAAKLSSSRSLGKMLRRVGFKAAAEVRGGSGSRGNVGSPWRPANFQRRLLSNEISRASSPRKLARRDSDLVLSRRESVLVQLQDTRDALAEMLNSRQRAVSRDVVPWFLDNMPPTYFQQGTPRLTPNPTLHARLKH